MRNDDRIAGICYKDWNKDVKNTNETNFIGSKTSGVIQKDGDFHRLFCQINM